MIFWHKNLVLRINFLLSLILNLLAWFFLYWQVQPTVEPIALRYNIYFGINLIGPWWYVFIWPLFGLGVLLLNFMLCWLLLKKQKYLAYFLSLSSSLVQLLILLMSFFTVLING